MTIPDTVARVVPNGIDLAGLFRSPDKPTPAVMPVKAGNTTYDVAEKWPDSPKYWGYETWGEVLAYAVGHGLGLTLHDPPGIGRGFKEAGFPPAFPYPGPMPLGGRDPSYL